MIRRSQPGDGDAVWALHMSSPLSGPPESEAEAFPDLLDVEGVYLHSGGELLVAELEGEVVGMAALLPTGAGRAEVRRMRVRPDVQGRGIGRRLLEELEARARDAGNRLLHLDTGVNQPEAIAFYRRAGYGECGRGIRGTVEVVLFEKELAPEGPRSNR